MSIFQKPFSGAKVKEDLTEISEVINDVGIKFLSEIHVACVFILDTSISMSYNNAIGKLNDGLRIFKEQTLSDTRFDEHTKDCIDVAIITFGSQVSLIQDFLPVSSMTVPTLNAKGMTAMGGALNMALDLIEQQKIRYYDFGTPYYIPWVFCITDGEPNDNYQEAAQRLKMMEATNKVLGYCVGVENFNRDVMNTIFDTSRIFQLDNLDFPGLFELVFNSLTARFFRKSDPNGGNEIDISVTSNLKMAF